MPHILIKEKQDISYPLIVDGVEFVDRFGGDNEDKILIYIDGYKFFLTKIKKDKNFLIKVDKTTRISILYLIKKALKAYVVATNSEILHSNIDSKKNKIRPKNIFLKDIEFFLTDFYKNYKKIYIEVGFGSGRHLLFRANEQKDALFIGIEIHTPSIEQVLKQIKIQNLDNIFIVNYDARLLLELIPSNIIDKIFLHFPVPWDKKPHRRVININFLNEALRVLKIDGNLEVRTDSINYFNWSKETIEKLQEYEVVLRKNKSLEISSKYEDRWIRQNKNIWDIIIKNQKLSKNKQIEFDFSFDDILLDLDILEQKISFTSIKKDNFFIHFKKVYKKDNKQGMILISFGDFDRAINTYLEVSNGRVKYFLTTPVPTKSNINAHIFLKNYFKGLS